MAKIKIFGQDVGILTKFAKQKNEAKIQPFWPNEFGVLTMKIVSVENIYKSAYFLLWVNGILSSVWDTVCIMRVIWKYRKNNNCGSVSS